MASGIKVTNDQGNVLEITHEGGEDISIPAEDIAKKSETAAKVATQDTFGGVKIYVSGDTLFINTQE